MTLRTDEVVATRARSSVNTRLSRSDRCERLASFQEDQETIQFDRSPGRSANALVEPADDLGSHHDRRGGGRLFWRDHPR